MSNIASRVILITGAAGGIGKILATQAALQGASIIACDINEEDLAVTVKDINDKGGNAIAVRTDVTDVEDMHKAVKEGLNKFGSVDVLVNNAGIMPLALYADHAKAGAAWSKCVDINLKGVLNGISAVYDQMIEQGRGHIINISSIYGNYPTRGASVYGATKAAVNYLSESLRQETQGKIKVTSVRPTAIPNTGINNSIINGEASLGIMGTNAAKMMDRHGQLMVGKAPESWMDSGDIQYLVLQPEALVDQIIYVIDQPWGVSISDITVRASGDFFVV